MYVNKRKFSEKAMSYYAFSLSYFAGSVANDFLFHALFCLALLLFLIISKEKIQDKNNLIFYFLVLISFAFGFVYGEKPKIPETPYYFTPHVKLEYKGHIESINSLTDKRLRLILNDVSRVTQEEKIKGKVVLYLNYERAKNFEMPSAGMKINFVSYLRPIHFSQNKGIFSAEQVWFNEGIFYTSSLYMNDSAYIKWYGKAYYFVDLREKLYKKFIAICRNDNLNKEENSKNYISQSHAFLSAIIFGERFYLNTETVQLFVKASLAHSIALSGMHLAFAVLCACFCVNIMSFIFPKILLYLPKKIIISLLSIPFACVYLWLGNAPISLIRASTMLFLICAFLLMYRKFSLLDCLVIASTCILLYMPRIWQDIAFQLSIFSVFAIALTSPLFNILREYLMQKSGDFSLSFTRKTLLYGLSLLWVSLSIQILLYPFQASVFGLISLCFPLNIIWLPLLQIFIMPLAFLGLIFVEIPYLSEIFIHLSTLIFSCFIEFLNSIEKTLTLKMFQAYRFDLWQGIGFYIFILSCLYYEQVKKKAQILIILSLICLLTAPIYKICDKIYAKINERMIITVLDVGQGQAILLEWGDKRALVDTGGVFGNRFDTGRDILAKVLTYQDFAKLDYLFFSHFDLDHVKGVFHLLKYFNIEKVIHSLYIKPSELRANLLEEVQKYQVDEVRLRAGEIFILEKDIFWFEVLYPPANGNFSSNNSSLVLRLMYRNKPLALFCGDIEMPAINALLKKDIDLTANILVLPHHGSKNSYSPEFYERVNPKIVAISSGRYNRYGFPAENILNYFRKRNILTENTGDIYALEYIFDKNSFKFNE